MSDGEISVICFFALLCILVLIVWIASGEWKVPDKFPWNWCITECWPPPGQEEPCDDCPYLEAYKPKHMREGAEQ